MPGPPGFPGPKPSAAAVVDGGGSVPPKRVEKFSIIPACFAQSPPIGFASGAFLRLPRRHWKAVTPPLRTIG